MLDLLKANPKRVSDKNMLGTVKGLSQQVSQQTHDALKVTTPTCFTSRCLEYPSLFCMADDSANLTLARLLVDAWYKARSHPYLA